MSAMLPSRANGFTIVELLVTLVIMGIVIGIFAQSLISAYRNSYATENSVQYTSAADIAMDVIERDIRYSDRFLATVSAPFSDPYGIDGTGTVPWAYAGIPPSPGQRVLILRANATSSNALGTGRLPVYTNTPAFDCASQVQYQPKLKYVIIYFVKDSNLYRRYLTDTTTVLCGGQSQAQKQTCPMSIPVASRNALCLANDEMVAQNVVDFSVDYYAALSPDPIDGQYTSLSQDVLDVADDASISLSVGTQNQLSKVTRTLRVTKVNNP